MKLNEEDRLEFEALMAGVHNNPHHFLGMHKTQSGYCVRVYLPGAKQCFVVMGKKKKALQCLDARGFFEGNFSKKIEYTLEVVFADGVQRIVDAYNFSPTLTDDDLYLFNQGNHHRIYNKLGAHCLCHEGVEGCAFAVWAPNAQRVSVVGDFNHWDGRFHAMRRLQNSGVWEIFIPGVQANEKYKYEIFDANNQLQLKSDPYGNYFEGAPNNASIVAAKNNFDWKDAAWLEKRSKTCGGKAPISIYEVHLDSWRHIVSEDGTHCRPMTYRELAVELVRYVKDLGFTHLEFLPVAEHPFLGSWGYQVTGFFAPTSRYGSPEDFRYLVDCCHQNDIGVIIDWVPGHFPKDAFALAKFDGTALYEHADPRQGEHQDWGTLIFNYGRHEVRNFLLANALFWFDQFHIDGLRVDAVASMLYLDYSRKDGEWIPNQYGGKENIEAIEFLRNVNDLVHQYYPGALMIAEESTAFGRVSQPTQAYGLGFDFKWNMGWMHDVLHYCAEDPLFRKYHHNQMTFGMLYQYSENFISVFSHDEVVYGKGSLINKMGSSYFADKVSTLKALYAYMWGWPGKKTLFMGDEFAQVNEWDYHKSLDWHLLQYPEHRGVQNLIRTLNALYRKIDFWSYKDLCGEGFSWIEPNDSENSVFSFIRKSKDDRTLLFVSNFTPVERKNYRLGVPHAGIWNEILNTDAQCFNGKNRGNGGKVQTEPLAWHHFSQSINIYLPPLSSLIFSFE